MPTPPNTGQDAPVQKMGRPSSRPNRNTVLTAGLAAVALGVPTLLPAAGGPAQRAVASPPTRAVLTSAHTPGAGPLGSGTLPVGVTTCSAVVGGTGFLVSPYLVVTTAHVVSGASSILLGNGPQPSPGQVVASNPSHDLAVVRSSRPLAGHIFPLGSSAPAVGDSVELVGYPARGSLTTSSGSVTGVGQPVIVNGTTLADMVQTNVASQSGESGGPLVGPGGTVVAVADSVASGNSGTEYAVPGPNTAALASSAQAHPRPVADTSCGSLAGTSPATTTPATMTPAGTANPSPGPASPSRSSSDATSVAQALDNYYSAIDRRDLAGAYALLTPGAQRAITESYFAAQDGTSYDFHEVVHSVSAATPATDQAWVTFTSHQSASHGPNGETCTVWSLDYTLQRTGGSWRIAGARPHAGGTGSAAC